MEEIIQLIRSVRNGNSDAFGQMCVRYKSLLDSMSYKYFGMCNAEYCSVDDFLQEAKMAFYNAIMRYDMENPDVTFGAFAKVCVRNRLVSCVRKQNSKKRRKGEKDVVAEQAWSLQDTVVRRELEGKLFLAATSVLSKYEMKIFTLYYSGRRATEISTIIGKDVRSVNNAVYRIKQKLKKTVAQ